MGRTFRRGLLLAAIAYVCFAALRAGVAPLGPFGMLLGAPIVLELLRRATDPSRYHGRAVEDAARSAMTATVWGGLLWLAARFGPEGHAFFDLAAAIGAGTTNVAALVAMARIPANGGLLRAPASSRSLDAAAFAGVFWGVAGGIAGARAIAPGVLRVDPLAIDLATTAAGSAGLLLQLVAALRLRWVRRLELGIGDRASGALALTMTAVAVAVPAAALDVAAPDRLLPAALVASGIAVTAIVVVTEPTRVSTTLRGAVATLLLGTPVVLGAGYFARTAPQHAGAVALYGTGLAIFAGILARSLARPLGPERSRWLEAIEAATHGALQPEPDAAIQAALQALSATSRRPGQRPELWRLTPPQFLHVDVAGYLHTEPGTAPDRLITLAMAEPERTLRRDVLEAVQVRRTEIRPVLSWMEDRGAYSATVVVDEDGPIGFLLLPGSGRRAPLTLEEARAIRVLADRTSALVAVSSALERSRQRELEARDQTVDVRRSRDALDATLKALEGRHKYHAERVAEPTRKTAYGPAARMALDAVEKAARTQPVVTLLTPPGVRAAGYGAAGHLASGRLGPFVEVSGAGPEGQNLALWEDPERSPLAQARGGTLLLVDVPGLAPSIQDRLAAHGAIAVQGGAGALPPDGPLPPARLVAVVAERPEQLAERHLLTPVLARALAPHVVALPPLVDRAEDLRALLLDALARAGMRAVGSPIGLDPAALGRLVEHPWPGNEAELEHVVAEAVAVAQRRAGQRGGVPATVTSEDLDAIGILPPADPTATPVPVAAGATRRRRTSRRPRR